MGALTDAVCAMMSLFDWSSFAGRVGSVQVVGLLLVLVGEMRLLICWLRQLL